VRNFLVGGLRDERGKAMNRAARFLICILGLATSFGAPAQTTNPPQSAPTATAKTSLVRVIMTTSLGRVIIDLEKLRAPITTANFLRYVDGKRLDGVTFYRRVVVAGWPNLGFVQFGTSNDPKRSLPPIAHEPTSKTGLTHDEGVISMARLAPGTARGDFFIMMGATPYMDADPTRTVEREGYAAFGKVMEGMEILRKIQASPTSPTKGVGVMKGQMLEPPIRILTVRRAPPTPK
jgi:peptidyl-prolyl cis-trans isomerase A (cyclophilin A)